MPPIIQAGGTLKAKDSTLSRSAGQFFIFGFAGYSVPADFKKLIEDYDLGGVIYFKKNVQSPAQLAELSNELQFGCRRKGAPALFISIDHEGGKVNRLVKPFTKFPGNDHLGELGSPKIGFEFGSVLGKELKAVGINVNYAPVVDVYTNRDNTVIRSRSFSADPEICARMGSAVSRGIQKMGVMAVGKHFPGHGNVKADSHHTLPKHSLDLDALLEREFIPFSRVIRSRIEGVMTAHILNEALDPEHPATLSPATLSLLRDRLRFHGVIFSDDMEMKAITKHYGAEEAALQAIKAGVDCLIYRREDESGLRALEAVTKAIKDGEISKDRIEASKTRILKAKKLFANVTAPIDITEVGSQIGLPEHFRLADIILKKERPSEADYV